MKLRFRLTLIIASMTAVIITAMSIILLRESRLLQTRVAFENMKNISMAEAIRLEQGFEISLSAIDTLARVFNGFQTFDEADRRPFFNQAIASTLASNSGFIGIYAVWKPGIIDRGSRIYSPLYTRERGSIEYLDFSIRDPVEYQRCLAAIAANDTAETISDPVTLVYQGRTIQYTVMSTPIVDDITHEIYGFVGVGMDLSQIQADIEELRPYGTGTARLYSNSGLVVADSDSSRIGKSIRETAVSLIGNEGIKLVEESLSSGQYRQIQYNGNIVVDYPFYAGTSKQAWTVLAVAPLETVLKQVTEMQVFTVIFAACMVIAAMVIVFFVIMITIKPVVNVAMTLKDISEGEGDLTRRISIKGNDEIADMAHYFNLTLEKIKNLILTIKQQAAALYDIGTELAGNMTQTASAINQITGRLDAVKSRVLSQSAGITENNASMEQITININKVNEHVERQTSSVSRSSSAIEEMLANIQSVTQTLVRNTENVNDLSGASEVGRAGLEGVAEDIQGIARESEGLLEINAVMKNIASQTNLLSMNAAIEAAHAGEAGKGFAVVADEIRKLAENSGEQSKTIGAVLKKIKDSIDKITVSTANVLSKFEAIDNEVKTVADQEADIRGAMEEQDQGSKQILEAIAQLNEITSLVKDGSREMLEGSQEVIHETTRLEKVTMEISGNMNEMSVGADQILVAINRINELTGMNRESINMLVKEVSRFRV